MERFSFILVTAGVLSFVFAFIVMAVLPWATYKDDPILTLEQIAEDVPYEFYKLERDFPDAFSKHFGEANSESFAQALSRGHEIYVAEGCWHCHSQQIRPVSNEDIRWGPVSYPEEFQNVLQMPVMFGTRRIGPDLIRSNGRHSNGWHLAHFYRPRDVVPDSVMPEYPWFYEGKNIPGRDALAITTYVQWLGSWVQRDMKLREQKLTDLAREEAEEAGINPDEILNRRYQPPKEDSQSVSNDAEAASDYDTEVESDTSYDDEEVPEDMEEEEYEEEEEEEEEE
jgi:cbb3-type cytochrome oxidase cytochrome c subunit